MYFYIYSLYKAIKFKYSKLGFLTNISIIITTSFCIAFCVITLSITSGFKINIVSKIIEIDGFAHIYPYNKNTILNDHINSLLKLNKNTQYLPFVESQAVIKYHGKSEGVNYIGSDNNAIINKYIINKFNLVEEQGLFIGVGLAEKLKIRNISDIFLLFADINNQNNIKKLKVIGLFQTHIPIYDDYFIYSNYNLQSNLEIMNKTNIDGFILNNNISNLDYLLNDFYIEKWDSKHNDFINWLSSYDIPIKILLLFVIIVALINNLTLFIIDITNRNKQIKLFHTFGMNNHQIRNLFLFKFIILNSIGILIGSLIVYISINLELKYNFVNLPSNIYFTDKLPILHNMNFYIYPSLIILFFVILLPFLFNKNFATNSFKT